MPVVAATRLDEGRVTRVVGPDDIGIVIGSENCTGDRGPRGIGDRENPAVQHLESEVVTAAR